VKNPSKRGVTSDELVMNMKKIDTPTKFVNMDDPYSTLGSVRGERSNSSKRRCRLSKKKLKISQSVTRYYNDLMLNCNTKGLNTNTQSLANIKEKRGTQLRKVAKTTMMNYNDMSRDPSINNVFISNRSSVESIEN